MKTLKPYILLVLTMVVFGSAFGYGMLSGVKAAGNNVSDKPMLVIAHRAGASFAPENTLAALEQAVRDGAAMAEIDVQQLKDGTLVVMHDSNFLRTAGVDRNVWDTNIEEMHAFDVGSPFSDAYAGEGIPTLEQMLLLAQNRICLMIELKYTGNEKDMELAVVNLLRKYNMEGNCVIGSMNQQLLETTKQIDARIPTVFIAHSLDEAQYNLAYADSYSIEAKNLTSDMVERIHSQDKPVYGWTANNIAAMKMIVDSGADGIVTDNVYQVQNFLKQIKREEAFIQFTKNYLPMIKKMVL